MRRMKPLAELIPVVCFALAGCTPEGVPDQGLRPAEHSEIPLVVQTSQAVPKTSTPTEVPASTSRPSSTAQASSERRTTAVQTTARNSSTRATRQSIEKIRDVNREKLVDEKGVAAVPETKEPGPATSRPKPPSCEESPQGRSECAPMTQAH